MFEVRFGGGYFELHVTSCFVTLYACDGFALKKRESWSFRSMQGGQTLETPYMNYLLPTSVSPSTKFVYTQVLKWPETQVVEQNRTELCRSK